MLDIERLIQMLARLPGLGPRSARRVALHLLKRRDAILAPLIQALTEAAANVRVCGACGNLDTADPCGICANPKRDGSVVCVVEDVADLWAMERTGAFRGHYHVLGGALSALDGVGPEELRIPKLIERVRAERTAEVILATNSTVEGQTTAHYIAERLSGAGAKVSGLAQGIPVGGELDYLDDGTLSAALKTRRPL
ncbi:MAG: recombination protein RecR [Rhodospirillales bacterium]|nr:recombination protein RecR [Rhodospirillales bacterium]MSP79714.1 recombination protein RecR [Rhodospirillales bacterium]